MYHWGTVYSVKGGEQWKAWCPVTKGGEALGEVVGKNTHDKPKSEREFQGRYLQDASSPGEAGNPEKKLRDKTAGSSGQVLRPPMSCPDATSRGFVPFPVTT